jgi:hypothetical protein
VKKREKKGSKREREREKKTSKRGTKCMQNMSASRPNQSEIRLTLQKAGLIWADPLRYPRIPLLGGYQDNTNPKVYFSTFSYSDTQITN